MSDWSDITVETVRWRWNHIKQLCQTFPLTASMDVSHQLKNHDQHNYITSRGVGGGGEKCKHHVLSSLYACGQGDNVLRGNKSALTATSKGAVRGLCYLRHRNAVAKHQSKTYQPFEDSTVFERGTAEQATQSHTHQCHVSSKHWNQVQQEHEF